MKKLARQRQKAITPISIKTTVYKISSWFIGKKPVLLLKCF